MYFVCLFTFLILLPSWFFLFKVEEQQKKALEEDPTVFDYDGVYDKMKEKATRPLVQDREERKVLVTVSRILRLTWKGFFMATKLML